MKSLKARLFNFYLLLKLGTYSKNYETRNLENIW